ncbi:MAG: CocE/NonD family hydrolase [Betaproteobacteria bacterium]
MRNLLLGITFVVSINVQFAVAQTTGLAWSPTTDEAATSAAMPDLAKRALKVYQEDNQDTNLNMRYRLQMVAGDFDNALTSLDALRELRRSRDPRANTLFLQYEILLKARRETAGSDRPFDAALKRAFSEVFGRLNDETAERAMGVFNHDLSASRGDMQRALELLYGKSVISLTEALDVLRKFQVYDAYRTLLPIADALMSADDARRYIVDEGALIKTLDGATLSAVIMRRRGDTTPQPAALYFNIYSNLVVSRNQARQSAVRGYVGVVADPRGKRLSRDEIRPYETEVGDVNAVIDWISRQPWSNGKVGMYGGSYTGFAQWAALKHPHPALKTIVPYVAVIPGLGLPMENNIFLTANYGWAFFVTNNRLLDNKTYFDPPRWRALEEKWYASGRPFREIDVVDGAANPWLQRWLQHPSYDAYWQSMVPVGKDFANINIPILSITGYFDDAQISALHYLREHYRYNPGANHYLLIGPSDHWGAQAQPNAEFRGYRIDPVAHINTPEITFQWLDYILKTGPKPELLRDKINYEVMGANEWRHAPTLEKAANQMLTLYLSDAPSGSDHVLAARKPVKAGHLSQIVDLADRSTTNNDYYPNPWIRKSLDEKNGLVFVSEPFDAPVTMTGQLSGLLKVTINKKDMDVGVVLYELTPNGEYFHLSYFIGRASYAKDMTKRQLLRPGQLETIPFDRTRMTSRQMSKGSRLVVVLNVNKNSGAQINYGTGKDVSDESIADAKTPLRVQWHNDSYVKIPVWR